jgi:hypothetical protein
MNTIKATVRGGRLEVAEPINLPDGTELDIPLPDEGEDIEPGWDNSPDGIAAWLKWYDSLEPLLRTGAEEAEAEAWVKQCDASAAKKGSNDG